MQQFVDTVMY